MFESKKSLALPRVNGRLTRLGQKPTLAILLLVLYFVFRGSFSSPAHAKFHKLRNFPEKIWQTWKVDPLSLEPRDLVRAQSWLHKNPTYRYEVLTDHNDIHYIETRYGPAGLNRPDIVYVYRQITAKIVRADMLRYLVMYAEGGVYSDIDVEALRPISRFIPDQYAGQDVDMVIGVEIDQPEFANHKILGEKCMSFCQWTFMAKPGLPIMLKLVDRIILWLNDESRRQNLPISGLKLDFNGIIAGTGPSAFTEAILEDISNRVGRRVTWLDTFHNMAESKLMAGYLILTVEAFAAGQGHSDSGNHAARAALVKHHYHASGWPTLHPRFSHPIYGEVERCNWDAQCVKDWDENTTKFDALPPAEKIIQLAIKKSKDETLAQEQAAQARAQAAAAVAIPVAPVANLPVGVPVAAPAQLPGNPAAFPAV